MDSTSVVNLNLTKGMIVMDVGMGDGEFAKACLDAGVDCVYGFESNEKSFALAEEKLKLYGSRAKIYKQAICRSDKNNYQLYETYEKDTGRIIISEECGVPVDAVRFDFIVSFLPKIDILRLNCNGGEFPILMTSKNMDKIGSIVGTTRPSNTSKMPLGFKVGKLVDNKFEDLQKFLEINGFTVEKKEEMFFAYKDGANFFFI